MSTEEKLASIRSRIDRLSQWLKDQEASDEAPAQDDSFAAFKTALEDVQADKDGRTKKATWSDVVAAAAEESEPATSDAKNSGEDTSTGDETAADQGGDDDTAEASKDGEQPEN